MNQGVPYSQFNNWSRKTHKKIVPVQIDGVPSDDEEIVQEEISMKETGGRIMLNIQTHDGIHTIEYLCCMAHVRAKFKYTYEQGMDARAKYFLDKIGWLYNQERKYQRQGLDAERIKAVRNNDETSRVIAELRKKLDYHLYFDKQEKGNLMQKAINYMHSFWKPLFRYRNDGNYTIDNSLAERSIRPMTMERKNSLFFCCTKGAKASAIFHTIIEICKQLDYLQETFLLSIAKNISRTS